MRRVRAVARLAHAVVHGLHGLAIVLFAFPSLDPAARHERIRWWSRKMLAVLGIAFEQHGTPAEGGSLLAANHVSWLDIMAIHAVVPRARAKARCAARRPRGRRGAERRPGGGDLPRRNNVERARTAAVPRQPAAG